MFGLVISLPFSIDQQETTIFAAIGFTPAGPAVGSLAAGLMSYIGGTTGIATGSAYAVAQSASMGGTATGVIATMGSMSVWAGMAMVAVPVGVAAAAYYAGPAILAAL